MRRRGLGLKHRNRISTYPQAKPLVQYQPVPKTFRYTFSSTCWTIGLHRNSSIDAVKQLNTQAALRSVTLPDTLK
jgi:hypothetical protein